MTISKLQGTIEKAPACVTGFDVDSVLTSAGAQNLKDAGYDFCIRYIPRTDAFAAGNLTNSEAGIILNAGLALMAVQHVSLPGWAPTADLGTTYGRYAATYASEIVGLPKGMNIWCDLEEVADGTPSNEVIAYCKAWYAAVYAAGYIPGLYVGYGVILTDEELYVALPFQHYWRAYNGQPVATRGYQLIQKTEVTVKGLTIDPDVTQNDNLGDTVLWLSAGVNQQQA